MRFRQSALLHGVAPELGWSWGSVRRVRVPRAVRWVEARSGPAAVHSLNAERRSPRPARQAAAGDLEQPGPFFVCPLDQRRLHQPRSGHGRTRIAAGRARRPSAGPMRGTAGRCWGHLPRLIVQLAGSASRLPSGRRFAMASPAWTRHSLARIRRLGGRRGTSFDQSGEHVPLAESVLSVVEAGGLESSSRGYELHRASARNGPGLPRQAKR
jgi:hypothetical protein